jgi:hypothetical protein
MCDALVARGHEVTLFAACAAEIVTVKTECS